MSSTTLSSSNFRLILDALDDYTNQTGADLTQNPFADKPHSCPTSDAVLELLNDRAKQFKEYREGNRKLINWLSPIVKVVHAFSDILREVVSSLPFQPAKVIFVGVDVLLAAASSVSASYDTLVDLFECIGSFLKRLNIYTKIPFPSPMIDIIVKIMVEVLAVLALATTQIKNGRLKKFAKKLLGEGDIEAVLQRLDRLTQEEARMTVAQTLEVVHGLVNNVKVVMDDGKVSTDGMRKALIAMQETANDVNKIKRDQLQRDVRGWLSPPDPSKNHNIARKAHHSGTAAWFTQGGTFDKWKTTGSLLWIHGKPGSGKSILCSTIIQEAKTLRDAGLALMAYFYFDFRDTAKQDLRGLLSSFLAQLSAKSDPCYDILSELYSTHDAGSQQPDDDALIECLKTMLGLPGQPAIYLILDALDECPNTSGLPTPRENVLELVEELLDLHFPNLRICVTSRPEVDIRAVLEPLVPLQLSIHEEGGQKRDIVDYISAVISSDRRTRRWRPDDKQLVIDTLSEKADGMFRWVFCQLETLRRCFPTAIRRALEELPETLDETYERTLLGIEKEKSEYAHRLFQCLTVSICPLRVDELAEVLAIQFDAETIPQYHEDWSPEDAQDAVLSACSSLIAIVNLDGSPVVQFSHFSVKEFLTSGRLATAGKNVSHYHVDPQSAHTVLAQASLSVLLQLDDKVDKDKIKNFPLAKYAARHWVDHAQFDKTVASAIQGMAERLFDKGKPQFATWVWIFDLDRPWSWVEHMSDMHPPEPYAVPLYYATLCGLPGLVERLASSSPGNSDSRGGNYTTPLHAALTKGYIDVALRLLNHGANVNGPNKDGLSPLHRASQIGRRDIAQLLLEHNADVNIRTNEKGETPLVVASRRGEVEVTLLLLQHGADVDLQDKKGWAPLMAASRQGHLDVVRLLLESGATVDMRDNDGWTPIRSATRYGYIEIVQELLDHGADINGQKDDLRTPLHQAVSNLQIAQLFIQRGATIDVKNKDGETPLDLAAGNGKLEAARLLIEKGASVNCQDKRGWTPLHTASHSGHIDIVKLLLLCGVDVNVRDGDGETPLDLASAGGELEVACFLIENGATLNCQDRKGWTPLHTASRCGHLDVVKLLLQYGLDANIRNGDEKTPLDLSSTWGHLEVTQFLIKSGADVNVRDKKGWSPLHSTAENGHLDVVRLLIESGAGVNVHNNKGQTPLDLASSGGKPEVVGFLAERMENADFRDHILPTLLGLARQTGHPYGAQSPLSRQEDATHPGHEENISLHSASREGDIDTVRSLLDHVVNVNARNTNHETPLDVASKEGKLEVATLLIERGAEVNCRDYIGWTPLHTASRYGHSDIVRLLLDHGAEVNAKNQGHWTPLHLASANGHLGIVRLLLERGAAVNVLDENGRTPSREAFANGYHSIGQLLSEYAAQGV